ncbi:LacI family DNA-binding transcriptional regulator [Arcticibacter sp.]|uniref:LacI family DNA-binding transcriptional regulator n=1 Tax=Arcticibacter sp. TaxID=1872630 RepID=UPI00388DBBE5
MKKNISIVDIAKHLNISTTTVSFVLNGRAKEKRISDELVERVLKFVEEVGYKPNVLARGLRTGKSNIIGLMVEDIANPFFATIAREIEENAYRNGYKIFYCSTDNSTAKTKELIGIFQDRQVDGYIIAPPEGIEDDVNGLIKAGSPVVLFDRFLQDVQTDYVGIDGTSSIFDAVTHLIGQGYERIGFVTLDSLQSQMQDRVKGYEQAISEHGLNDYIKEISYHQSPDNIVKQVVAFLKKKSNLQAVVFSTNYLGVSGLKAISSLGLKIPDDIAVMAFDELDLFELHSPSISTVSQPVKGISEHAISILLGRMDGSSPKKDIQNVILPTSLIVRDSTKYSLK